MPTTVDLKHEYFTHTWPGRVKITEIVSLQKTLHLRLFVHLLCLQLLAILCMILVACPVEEGTQTWFLIVIVFAFLGTFFLCLYYLCVDQLVKGWIINWSQAVSEGFEDYCRLFPHGASASCNKTTQNPENDFLLHKRRKTKTTQAFLCNHY